MHVLYALGRQEWIHHSDELVKAIDTAQAAANAATARVETVPTDDGEPRVAEEETRPSAEGERTDAEESAVTDAARAAMEDAVPRREGSEESEEH